MDLPFKKKGSNSVVSCQREGDAPDVLCRIPHALDTRVLDTGIHEAIKAYLARRSPITPPEDGRMVATDLPKPVRSQYEALFGASLGRQPAPVRFSVSGSL